MYDDRWCRFTRWAAGQGVDPLNPTAAQVASFLFDLFDTHGLSPRTIKGYRTCIGSVLNRTGKTKVVLHRTISDMIASMELQRPRATPVFPQWDLGVVLEALNKDNNAGKELSAPSISRWICTTIVDSHAAIQDSKNLSGSVKAHEVRAVATSLQLFNKADLHSVMKSGRWSSGGTFTSFYLRDLCPQAESLQRAGPIVAAGDIVKISTF